MIIRFLKYYKPHLPLFLLDMGVAIFSSLSLIFFPFITHSLLKEHIPNKNIKMIIILLPEFPNYCNESGGVTPNFV